MRILIVSNLYPPFFEGGYELACKKAADALTARGHEVTVLTSDYGIKKGRSEGRINRQLRLHFAPTIPWYTVIRKEWKNQRIFKRLYRSFKPEIVFFWNLTHISLSLVYLAQAAGIPTCFYVFDNWLARCESDHWYQWCNDTSIKGRSVRIAGHIMGLERPAGLPKMQNAVFASLYLKHTAWESGKPVSDNRVVHWGVDVNSFSVRNVRAGLPGRLLYVGQIAPHKGVHTILDALRILLQEYQYRAEDVMLTIVGDTSQMPEYTSRLRDFASKYALENNISFAGKMDGERVAMVYPDHDIFIFPSIWDEPFGITQLEAMASGLAVLGTGTGGASEILKGSCNALLFEKNNPASCARQIKRLLDDPKLFDLVSRAGRITVKDAFPFGRLVDSLEDLITSAQKANAGDGNNHRKRATADADTAV